MQGSKCDGSDNANLRIVVTQEVCEFWNSLEKQVLFIVYPPRMIKCADGRHSSLRAVVVEQRDQRFDPFGPPGAQCLADLTLYARRRVFLERLDEGWNEWLNVRAPIGQGAVGELARL